MKGTAYLIQATLISLWWIGMLINERVYNAFLFPSISHDAFNAFMLPDLIIVAFLSIIRAYKKIKELDYVILGGFGFATLYCINATILTGGGFLSTTVMIFGLFYNLFLISKKQVFKTATTSNVLVNSVKTLFQIVCIWMITLFVIPMLIMDAFEIAPWTSEISFLVAIILFATFSVLGLYSAYIMVKEGGGTPLPIDQTQRLVITGPYNYVRNPMAIAGLGQGLSISVLYGSIHILIYTLIGGVLWQLVVRPFEEKDMVERFGNDYLEYSNKVKCWFPKIG